MQIQTGMKTNRSHKEYIEKRNKRSFPPKRIIDEMQKEKEKDLINRITETETDPKRKKEEIKISKIKKIDIPQKRNDKDISFTLM